MNRPSSPEQIATMALEVLRGAYGQDAQFREGQLDAITDAVVGKNQLVVQRTGWGKSLVYFISTKILREHGAGPTLIISPLLALMENQIDSAAHIGLQVATINTNNKEEWDKVFAQLRSDEIDALIISPERLANEQFMEKLADVRNIQLLVVDEAHSISDWGHDFRPDYQRIAKIIDGLPVSTTILGTTATANDRVIRDIKEQLGDDLAIIRGDLLRENLAIQINPDQTRDERLAWLADALSTDALLSEEQGLIYCLTRSDCDLVAEFLRNKGISVLSYYSNMGQDQNGENIEELNLNRFERGEVRVLACTVKLGMGYDNLNIRFVIHFQLPQNLIHYYQQIGRAGRTGEYSYAILLHGEEDQEILDFFIEGAQTPVDYLQTIVDYAQDGVKRADLMQILNMKLTKLEEALKYLQVRGFLYKDGAVYRANPVNVFNSESEERKQRALRKIRCKEAEDLIAMVNAPDCSMRYVAEELDAPDLKTRCGICANCVGRPLVSPQPDQELVASARTFLDNRHGTIAPRKKWGSNSPIPKQLQMQNGWVLYADYYSAGGKTIKEGKYELGSFGQEILDNAVRYLNEKVIVAGIDCIVPVPSLNHPELVPDFARHLAEELEVDFAPIIEKTSAVEQKTLLNSVQQEQNIRNSTIVENAQKIEGKTILLVDDMVDSKWTFTVLAAKLLEQGASAVYPFALVRTGNSD